MLNFFYQINCYTNNYTKPEDDTLLNMAVRNAIKSVLKKSICIFVFSNSIEQHTKEA